MLFDCSAIAAGIRTEPAPLYHTRMARGRGGSDDFGVVTTRRRYMSVDPDLELGSSGRSRRIADYSINDADVLSSKSRNKDRDLLNDITQRLDGNNHYADPFLRTSYFPRKLPESPLFIIAGSRRGGSVPPPRRTKVEVFEEDIPYFRPTPAPLPPRITPTVHRKRVPSHRARAASEPPRYTPLKYKTTLPSIYTSYTDDMPYLDGERYYHHTSRPMYYRGTAPYAKRYVPYIPYDLTGDYEPVFRATKRQVPYLPYDYTEEYAPVFRATYSTTPYLPSNHAAVRNARRHLDTLERELGMQNGPTIADPIVIHHVHAGPTARVVASPHGLRSSYRVPAGTTGIRHRSSSLPPSPKGGSRRSRLADIESRMECESAHYPEVQPESMTSLRSRTTAARDKMDAHKVMMDRYLPIHFGPENEVEYEVDYKFGELVNRMPGLDRHRPHQGAIPSAGNVAPYKPVSTYHRPPTGAGHAPRTTFRPKVSETRKRIREVMCATKKDPHYYD